MTGKKLDMGAAWSSATALIAQNRDTVSAIIGLFFFLPYLAVGLLAPDTMYAPEPEVTPGATPDAALQMALDQMSQSYIQNWPLLLTVTVVQFIGSLSLLALLSNRDSPTVGQALQRGLAAAPSYLAAQLLSAVLVAVLIGIPLGLVGMTGIGAAILLLFPVIFAVAIYMLVKFALIAPVIAIEGERSPIKALRRSWALTKGNSLRIALFLVLLIITIGIIGTLVSLVLGLVFALFSQGVADIGNAVVASLVNTALGVILLVVLSAVHQQLAGPSEQQLAATFE